MLLIVIAGSPIPLQVYNLFGFRGIRSLKSLDSIPIYLSNKWHKKILTAAEFSRIYKLTKNENNNEVLYLLSLIENGYSVVIQLDCLLFVLLGRYATDGFFSLARANKQWWVGRNHFILRQDTTSRNSSADNCLGRKVTAIPMKCESL